MEINSNHPKVKQKEVAIKLDSTLQRYRYDMKIQNTYKSNNPERAPKTSNHFKRPQMTSNETNENDQTFTNRIKTQ